MSHGPLPSFTNAPYLDPNYSPTLGAQSARNEFEEREEQYNYQIQKMSDHIHQLEHELAIAQNHSDGNHQDYIRVTHELQCYKDQLKKLFQIYNEQTKQYEAIMKKVQDSNQSTDKAYVEHIGYKNDIQNLVLDRDLLLNKLEMGDKQYNFDIQSLTAQLNDKNAEIADQKRRIQDLIDSKRKAEEEIASLRFTLDHQTSKLESELRERTLKLEALDKQFQEALYLKDNELVDAFDKIRILEHEVRRILDLNRNYAQELSMMARDNRFKQEELNRKPDPVKPQIPISTQSGNMEPRMPPEWADKMHQKIDKVLDLYETNHDREVKQLCLNLWKTKMELSARNKQNKSIQGENAAMAKGTATMGGGNIDFRVPTYLIDQMISVITFTRESISNIIFEIFVRSVNKANSKKLNSFVLFYESLKEVQSKPNKGLWLSLEIYTKLRKGLRHSVPLLIDTRVANGVLEKVELAMGKLLKHEVDFRNNVNKWLEGTIAFTIQKKEQESYDKNQDYLFLFRLLTLKYRIKFPLTGKTFEVDVDLETFLEHKICYSLRKIVKVQSQAK